MTERPVLYVLAGVNGAGKSSVGGYLLRQHVVDWFDPDAFARELRAATGISQTDANAIAWQEGMRRLDRALAEGRHYAFETTLGGRTVPARILAASQSHDVLMWFCGLDTPERHIARVRARVSAGGHDIPEAKIRERFPAAMGNLIGLMPHLAHLRVFDNSAEAGKDGVVPDPVLVLELQAGKLVRPRTLTAMRRTPEWAKGVVEAAFALHLPHVR